MNNPVNNPVNFDIVCIATAIKELCQARDMGDTQLFNRQELTIMINTLCKQYFFYTMLVFVLYSYDESSFICQTY